MVKSNGTSMACTAWCNHPLQMHCGNLSLLCIMLLFHTVFDLDCEWMSHLWGWIWFVIRESLVQKQKVEVSGDWDHLRTRKKSLMTKLTKALENKIQSSDLPQSSHIKMWSALHQVFRDGQLLWDPSFVTSVCHLICNVLGIYISSWNHCEQYLECIKCCVMLSSLKKNRAHVIQIKYSLFSLIS